MDGPYIATVQFKSNTKNCFVSVPSSWIKHQLHDTVIVFEVLCQAGKSLYLSWSGDTTTTKDTIVLSGFYALKLGLSEGEQVTVVRRKDVSSVEIVAVEPVSVDDWEILELHTDFIQNNILHQVRVVWNEHILPIWVNQSVCIFVKLSKLIPDCQVGLLVDSTELHITPKGRSSSSTQAQPIHTNVPENSTSSVASQPAAPTIENNQQTLSDQESSIGDKFKSFLNSRFTSKSQVLSTKEADQVKNMLKSTEVTLRVHPFDINVIVEHLNQSGIGCSDSNDLRMLLLQPSNVFVTSQSCHLSPTRQNSPILIGKLTNVTEKSDGKSQQVKSKQPVRKVVKECFVKVVLLDYLLDYAKNGDGEIRKFLIRLINEEMDNAILVPQGVRRFISCAVTTRVKLTIHSSPKTVKPATIFLFPLQTVKIKTNDQKDIKEKEKEMNAQIDIWRNSISSLSCPLFLSNKFVVSMVIDGTDHEFILQSNQSDDDASNDALVIATPATGFQPRWEIVVKDETLNKTDCDWDTVSIGQPSIALGGFGILIGECKMYLKLCLNLGPLARQLRVCNFNGKGLLICGSSGTGKSSIARALARDLSESPNYVYSDYINGKALQGKRPENIIKTWQKCYTEAARRQPSILILDDLDQIIGTARGPEGEIGPSANYRTKLADSLKDLIKNCNANVITVATCKSVSTLHPTLSSAQGLHLFEKIIKIPSPDFEQRLDILKRVILSKPLASSSCIESDDIDWSSLVNQMEGYVPHDLNAIVNRALHHAISTRGHSRDETEVTITRLDVDKSLSDYVPIALRSLNIHKAGDKCWSDVGGLMDVKRTLIETLQWPSKYPKLFASCPLAMRSGILIYGPPGTGKTLLAEVLAKESHMNFISIKGPELLSKYIGASEQAVRDLFERAANAKPCVIFFDEFDSLAPRRGHDSTGVTDRVVNQLLTQMDGVEGRKGVYVLAATSRPDMIDPALLRPGRLDKCLYCRLPSSEEREQILTALSRSLTLADDVNMSTIADVCQDFSGADLQGLLYNAQMDAIQRSVGHLYADVDNNSAVEMDYVICKRDEPDLEMLHFRKLQDGPEECDLEYLKTQKQKMTCILSNVEKMATGSEQSLEDDKTGHKRTSVIVVNQNNLLEAATQMKPSVASGDRKRYELIYESFIKSRSGHFESSTQAALPLTGNRATLA